VRGLTLLEVLISVTITGIIMAALYGAYTSNVEAIQLTRQGSEVYQIARIALDRMSKDLESAILEIPQLSGDSQLGFIGKNQEIDGKSADRLDFTTLTHLPLTGRAIRTDLCEVGYTIREDEETGVFVLYRRDDGSVDDDFTGGGHKNELARGVTRLDIFFQDSEGNEFEDWNSLEGEPVDQLPSLIVIKLTIGVQGVQDWTFMTSVHPALAGRIEEY
jgi:prepilin-type N-terminal cleavage/methylation domain-containing protein